MATDGASNSVLQRAREFLDLAGSRTGQLARIARLEIDLLGIDRERKGALAQLGERAFDLMRRGEGSRFDADSAIAGFVQRVRELDAEKLQREREISEIRGSLGGAPVAGGRP